MSETAFAIDTELSPAYLEGIVNYIYEYYLKPHPDVFIDIRRAAGELAFTDAKHSVEVSIKAESPVKVKMIHSEEVLPDILEEIKEDLIIGLQLYEEKIRKQTIYFAWVKGEQVLPESVPGVKKRAADRIFSDSMVFFYILTITISILLFSFLGYIAALLVIAIQLLTIIFADKIMLRLGKWRVDEKNPFVYLLQYQLPAEESSRFQQQYGKDVLLKMKREIYEKTFAVGKEPTCEYGEEIFKKYGVECVPERMAAKQVNVYGLVKRASQKFSLPVPKITLSNSMVPNAAASGINPDRGTIMITTGLLVQLDEDEIYGVIGHEMAHLNGRDSIILFALTAAEYLLRIYVFLPVFLAAPFIYLILAMGTVYFIAKFFEARADLESAIKIGKPEVLASALRKISFQRLRYERAPEYRVQEWLSWDPHPPAYFRIARLEKLEGREIDTEHTLIQSARDVFGGFRGAI